MTTFYLNLGIDRSASDVWILDDSQEQIALAVASRSGSSIVLPLTLSLRGAYLHVIPYSDDSSLWMKFHDEVFQDGIDEPILWQGEPLAIDVGIEGGDAYTLRVERESDRAKVSKVSTISKFEKLKVDQSTEPGTSSPSQGLPGFLKELRRGASSAAVRDALFEAVAALTASRHALPPGVAGVLALQAKGGNRRAKALLEETNELQLELTPRARRGPRS